MATSSGAGNGTQPTPPSFYPIAPQGPREGYFGHVGIDQGVGYVEKGSSTPVNYGGSTITPNNGWDRNFNPTQRPGAGNYDYSYQHSGGNPIALGDYGYSPTARPYEFNEPAFANPYEQRDLGVINAGMAGAAGDYAGVRGVRSNLTSMLMDQAQGNGPSVAELTYRKTLDDNIRNLSSMAASGGNNPALRRAAMFKSGELGQQASADTAMIRSNEMQKARETLGQISGQDQQQLAQLTQYYTTQGLSLDQAQWAAQMDLEKLRAQQHQAAQATQAGISAIPNNPSTGERVGMGVLQGAALIGAAAASDERLKTKVISGKKDIHSFLKGINAHRYRYKDQKWGDKTYYSPMAQELEKTKVGKSMVVDTPEGKMVDYARSGGVILAALAHLQQEIEKK
jgi:hypothetical protein